MVKDLCFEIIDKCLNKLKNLLFSYSCIRKVNHYNNVIFRR